jgi:hypothetical protein
MEKLYLLCLSAPDEIATARRKKLAILASTPRLAMTPTFLGTRNILENDMQPKSMTENSLL